MLWSAAVCRSLRRLMLGVLPLPEPLPLGWSPVLSHYARALPGPGQVEAKKDARPGHPWNPVKGLPGGSSFQIFSERHCSFCVCAGRSASPFPASLLFGCVRSLVAVLTLLWLTCHVSVCACVRVRSQDSDGQEDHSGRRELGHD
jgi:hypothetical protein